MKTRLLFTALFVVALGASAQEQPERTKPNPQEMFKKMDTDADGRISKAEAQKFKDGKTKMNENFAKIDKNKDSYLDKEELKEFRKNNKPRR